MECDEYDDFIEFLSPNNDHLWAILLKSTQILIEQLAWVPYPFKCQITNYLSFKKDHLLY